jgi:nucleoside-diphosphate-sugar epimerase
MGTQAVTAPLSFLITGCTGFIGLHLTRRLLDAGHRVVGLVRNSGKMPADLAGRVEVITGDLSRFREPDLALPPVDIVIHLAAVIAGKNEAEYGAINRDAVADLVAAIERQAWRPRRLLFASSLAAAGPSAGGVVHRESDATAPIDPYGAAKREAEEIVRAASFPTTSFRPPLVIGPGDPATLTLFKMVASGVAALPAGEPQRLSFVAVDDLTRAIVAMAGDSSSQSRLYFVTAEEPMTNRSLLASIGRAMGRRFVVVPVPRVLLRVAMEAATAAARVIPFTNQLDRKQYEQMVAPGFVCTSERLTADTGWKATRSLDEATRVSVDGYRALGWL